LFRLKGISWGLVLLLAAAAGAQAPRDPAPPPSSSAAQSPAPSPSKPDKKRKEKRISHADAEELFRSMDRILKFVSEDTGLPILHPVARALATREQVEAFVQKEVKGDRSSEVVLKKFGLLPRDFDLGKYLVDLMGEQVAGYYDTKTRTMYLLDWVRPETQQSVLAHELTHALQDQSFDLEKWLHPAGPKDEDDVADETSTTRRAVVEGQAMMTLIDYMLQPTGQRLTFSPEILAQFGHLNFSNPDFPLLKSAPPMLQDVLSFPYTYGLGFEYELLLHGGKKRAFREVFRAPPVSTRQIMEPETYLRGEQIPPMRFPEMKPILGSEYRRHGDGAVGEFDVYLLLKQFSGEKEARKLSTKWRGGIYFAAEKGVPEAAQDAKPEAERPVDPASIALLYFSRWATPADAQRFSNGYATSVEKKYRSTTALPQTDTALRAWSTEEGPVYIAVEGDRVVVTESFDDATAARLRAALLAQSEPALVAVR
jgi:hypothetical protein